MTRSLLLLPALVSLVACGGGAAPEPTDSTAAASAGGETPVADGATAAEPPDTASPDVAPGPSTDGQAGGATQQPTPGRVGAAVLSVPLPGTPRASLRADVQELMARIEDVAAIRPPNPSATLTQAQLEAYVQGPFLAWVEQRVRATQEASRYAASLSNLGPVERGFAAALIAYAYEDMATSVRGMPLPPFLARDTALMQVFQETIDRALLPIAEYAATGYDGCIQVFGQARAAGWEEWPGFCSVRLEDLREVFGRYATQPAR